MKASLTELHASRLFFVAYEGMSCLWSVARVSHVLSSRLRPSLSCAVLRASL